MTEEILNKEYFDWMYSLVCAENASYQKLLRHLNTIEFTHTIPMDDNRAVDGINLRYRFAYEKDYHPAMIAEYIDNKPCSVLEMMVALAHRCEEQIMADQELGDRTERWFMDMIKSLGLKGMTNSRFDEFQVERAVTRFLIRDYKPNGEGGLFTVNRYRRDMRIVEIWYQMCWYLDEVLEGDNRED